MAYELVATGTSSDIEQLGNYQGAFPEGSKGYVELELRSELAADIVSWLDERLQSVGVPEEKVEVVGRFIRIHFATAIAPLVLIAAAIAASILIIALVVAWKLFRLSAPAVVGVAVGTIILIALAVLAVIFLIATRGRLEAGQVTVGR